MARRSPVLPAVSTVGRWRGGALSCLLSQELQRAAVPAESTAPPCTRPHGVRGARPGLGRGAPGAGRPGGRWGSSSRPLLPAPLFRVVPLLGFLLLCLGSVSLCLCPLARPPSHLPLPRLLLGLSPARCSPQAPALSQQAASMKDPSEACGPCDHAVVTPSSGPSRESSHAPGGWWARLC